MIAKGSDWGRLITVQVVLSRQRFYVDIFQCVRLVSLIVYTGEVHYVTALSSG